VDKLQGVQVCKCLVDVDLCFGADKQGRIFAKKIIKKSVCQDLGKRKQE